MELSSVVCSNIGKVRGNNQDNFYYFGKYLTDSNEIEIIYSQEANENEYTFAVFDGMGGEYGGEVASLLVSQKLDEYLNRYDSKIMDKFNEHIIKFTQSANNSVCKKIVENGGNRMGTTYALLTINKKQARVANIGDSKVLFYRDGELTQITIDHNHAQTLLEMGMVTKNDARYDENKNKLTQYIGINESEMILEPLISETIVLNDNDIFLICSDGLTDMLTDLTISHVLNMQIDSIKKAQKLVSMAVENGGNDNITVILVEAK